MGQRCSICRHPHREEIDRALIAGEPRRRIAARYAVSETSLRRHAKNHLPEKLARAQEVQDVVSADKLLASLQEIKGRLKGYEGIGEQLLQAIQQMVEEQTSDGDMVRLEDGPRGGKKLVFVGGPLLQVLGELRKFIDSYGRLLDLEARVSKIIEERGDTTINIINNPQWVEMTNVLFSALTPFPEAKSAVYEVFKALTDGHSS